MTIPAMLRPLGFAVVAVGLALVAASMGGSAASPAPSGGPDACIEYGRQIRQLAWDPTGRLLAVHSWYHRDSRIELIDWPSMTVREVDRSPYAHIDHAQGPFLGRTLAVDTDGTVWWAGIGPAGPRVMRARPGAGRETWWAAESSDPMWSIGQLSRTPGAVDMTVLWEHDADSRPFFRHVRIEDSDPSAPRIDTDEWFDLREVTPDGETWLVVDHGRLYDSGTVEVRQGTKSIAVDVGLDAEEPSLSPDGRHVLWLDARGLLTRPVEGGTNVRIADDARRARVGPHGIVAYASRSVRFDDYDAYDETRFDPPLAPQRLCFARAPWADRAAVIPPMPAGATHADREPVRPIPPVTMALSALLPTEVAGLQVSWANDVTIPPRSSSRYEFGRSAWHPAISLAARSLGVDPYDLFVGSGSAYPDRVMDEDVGVYADAFADPAGDGARWIELLRDMAASLGPTTRIATADVVEVSGRTVTRVTATDPAADVEPLAQYLLASGPYVFVVNTNVPSLAEAFIAALP